MLAELDLLLAAVPVGSDITDYRDAIQQRNVLNKNTESTRKESFRRLRELYSLDEGQSIFGLLRRLYEIDPNSLPLLAIQVAWARDPLLRATSQPVLDAADGDRVETVSLAQSLDALFPKQYSELSRDQTARHAASSWTQSGHLSGRTKKIRQRIKPTPVAVTMALILGHIAGYHGAVVFSNPWCALLDLSADRAKTIGQEAHRAGLLNLRMVGEVVDLSFPLFAAYEPELS